VEDTTAPELTLPANVTVECTSPGEQTVEIGSATATDACGNVTITNDAPSTFPHGTTTVTWTADDGNGNSSSDEQSVTVEDTTPPVITVTMDVQNLWPPNHKMHLVGTGTVTDVCAEIGAGLTFGGTVTSNQDINGLGDGNTDPDWTFEDNGDGTFNIWLRAERSGKNGERIYSISVTATDGLQSSTTPDPIEVHVVHNQGKGKKNASKVIVISSPDQKADGLTSVVSGALPENWGASLASNITEPALLEAFDLVQNYPNPFNPSTTIRYDLAQASEVRLSIFNVLGQRIRVLVNTAQSAGTHSVRWDGRDAAGKGVSTGLYLYKLEAGVNSAVRTMVFAK
jgi:hypothetical protein